MQFRSMLDCEELSSEGVVSDAAVFCNPVRRRRTKESKSVDMCPNASGLTESNNKGCCEVERSGDFDCAHG